jgi:hypothetical protein
MVQADGTSIAPTGKRFAISMATIGHWKDAGPTLCSRWPVARSNTW